MSDCQCCGANLELHGRNIVIDKTIDMELEYCDECYENCIVEWPPEFDSSGNLVIA